MKEMRLKQSSWLQSSGMAKLGNKLVHDSFHDNSSCLGSAEERKNPESDVMATNESPKSLDNCTEGRGMTCWAGSESTCEDEFK